MTAAFLNAPPTKSIANSGKWKKYAITLEPLVVQYAGDPIPKSVVNAFLHSWREVYNYQDPNFDAKKYLEDLTEYYFPIQQVWVVPAGRVTDGPSVPRYVFWIKPREFYYSGIWHDWARGWFNLGNASTDGVLQDLSRQEGMGKFRSKQIHFGVWIGTLTKYKCPVPPNELVSNAYAQVRHIQPEQVKFDPENFEVNYQMA